MVAWRSVCLTPASVFPDSNRSFLHEDLVLPSEAIGPMNAGGSAAPHTRLLVVGALLATSGGCVCIVRSVEITRVEPARLATVVPSASPESANEGLKQTIKLQYLDGTSILFRSGVRLEGNILLGDGLRAAPDVLGGPLAVTRFPTEGLVGGVLFRERTNVGASVALSVAGTAAAALVMGAIAAGISSALDRAAADALGCALGGACSISSRWSPRLTPALRARGPAPYYPGIGPAGRIPR